MQFKVDVKIGNNLNKTVIMSPKKSPKKSPQQKTKRKKIVSERKKVVSESVAGSETAPRRSKRIEQKQVLGIRYDPYMAADQRSQFRRGVERIEEVRRSRVERNLRQERKVSESCEVEEERQDKISNLSRLYRADSCPALGTVVGEGNMNRPENL